MKRMLYIIGSLHDVVEDIMKSAFTSRYTTSLFGDRAKEWLLETMHNRDNSFDNPPIVLFALSREDGPEIAGRVRMLHPAAIILPMAKTVYEAPGKMQEFGRLHGLSRVFTCCGNATGTEGTLEKILAEDAKNLEAAKASGVPMTAQTVKDMVDAGDWQKLESWLHGKLSGADGQAFFDKELGPVADYLVLNAAKAGRDGVIAQLAAFAPALKSSYDNLPLQIAAEADHVETVRYLAHNNPRIAISGQKALLSACHAGAARVVEVLLEAGVPQASDTGIYLFSAVSARSVETAKVLLEAGARADLPNPGTLFSVALLDGDVRMLNLLKKHGATINSDQMMMYAAVSGRPQAMDWAVANGGDIWYGNGKFFELARDDSHEKNRAVRDWLEGRREKLAQKFRRSGFSLPALRAVSPVTKESALMEAAIWGAFDRVAEVMGAGGNAVASTGAVASQEKLSAGDFLSRSRAGVTLAEYLVRHGQQAIMMDEKLWRGRLDELQALRAGLPEAVAGQLDFQGLTDRVALAALAQSGNKNAEKFRRKRPAP